MAAEVGAAQVAPQRLAREPCDLVHERQAVEVHGPVRSCPTQRARRDSIRAADGYIPDTSLYRQRLSRPLDSTAVRHHRGHSAGAGPVRVRNGFGRLSSRAMAFPPGAKVSNAGMLPRLARQTPSRILVVVLDGLGGVLGRDRTALERAHHPHLDALARVSALGRYLPLAEGLTPGSGPGHLSIFGFDPFAVDVGRGLLETLGVGVDVHPGDVC